MKQLRNKKIFVSFLSLGLILLGISCISFAMLRRGAYSDLYVAASPETQAPVGWVSEVSAEAGLPADATPPPPVKVLYPVIPPEGELIGNLTIPSLDRKLPIYQGTDESELERGVGHFLQSVLPGVGDNCVLSGHRDTVFRQLDLLKWGDRLIVETSAGKFTYEVQGSRIVHADDRTVIVPTGSPVLTLTTCYPFYYLGNAPDRYIVTATLINV